MSATLEGRILLTRNEAARAVGLSERTISKHTAPNGSLVAVRIGRSVRYSPDDLSRWIASQRDSLATVEATAHA